MIGLVGLWFSAKFRAIAFKASIGAAAARHYVLVPLGPPPEAGTLTERPGEAVQPLHLLASAGLDPELGTNTSGNGSLCRSSPTPPGLQIYRHDLSPEDRGDPAGRAGLGLDDADLDGLEDTIADCTEAIRLDPDSPQLYLERAGAYSRLDRYAEAVADYDLAISLDADNAAAYLGRCHAKSELGRHEEAIEDYDRAVQLDPVAASPSSDG